MFDFLGFGKTLKSFASELTDLRVEIETTARQIEDIQFAPAHLDDVFASLEVWAERGATEYRKHLQSVIGGIVHRPGLDSHGVHSHLSSLEVLPEPSMYRPLSRDKQLCGLLGPAAFVEIIRGQVKYLDLPASGLRMAEREPAIAALQKKLGKLVAKEAEMIAAAQKEGINVS